MMFNKLIIVAVCCVAIVACSQEKPIGGESNEDGVSIVLQQQWFSNSGFAGEVWAQEFLLSEYKGKVDFKVLPGSDQVNTIGEVVAGRSDFGVAGAEQVMQANMRLPKGEELVVVGVINHDSLAGFASRAAENILSPADFADKKVGTMVGSPVDMIYRVLLKINDIVPRVEDGYQEIDTGWVTTGFINGSYDIHPVFVNDEPVTFNNKGIAVSVVKPKDYGVDFIGTVYFCKKELIKSNPEKVQIFVNLMIDGWKSAIKFPKKAIEAVARQNYSGETFDSSKELRSHVLGMDYYKGENGKVLYASKEKWLKMAEQIKISEVIEKFSFDYDSMVNNDFVDWYHFHEKKK